MSISYQIHLFDKDNVVSWSLLQKIKNIQGDARHMDNRTSAI